MYDNSKVVTARVNSNNLQSVVSPQYIPDGCLRKIIRYSQNVEDPANLKGNLYTERMWEGLII